MAAPDVEPPTKALTSKMKSFVMPDTLYRPGIAVPEVKTRLTSLPTESPCAEAPQFMVITPAAWL
jgi:hypothetical protein